MERLVIRLFALFCSGVVLPLASCDGNGPAGPEREPSPWEDCAVGQILAPGSDPCTYPGRNEVVSVNASGEACFDDDCADVTLRWHFRTENGKTVIELELTAIGDGRYGITRLGKETRTVREILQGAGELEEPVVCSVGLTLGPGESCRHDDGTNSFVFEVKPDGRGCVGSLCVSGSSLSINALSATRDGDTWTIKSLPGE